MAKVQAATESVRTPLAEVFGTPRSPGVELHKDPQRLKACPNLLTDACNPQLPRLSLPKNSFRSRRMACDSPLQ